MMLLGVIKPCLTHKRKWQHHITAFSTVSVEKKITQIVCTEQSRNTSAASDSNQLHRCQETQNIKYILPNNHLWQKNCTAAFASFPVQILTGTLVILTDIFCGLPQYLQKMPGLLPSKPPPFHYSSYHWHYIVWATCRIIK